MDKSYTYQEMIESLVAGNSSNINHYTIILIGSLFNKNFREGSNDIENEQLAQYGE